MKINLNAIVLFILLSMFVFLISACGGLNESQNATAIAMSVQGTVVAGATETALVEPTRTPIPTDTSTPEPTLTPKPTNTPRPTITPKPTATPYQPKFSNIEPFTCRYDEFQNITWCSKYVTDDIDALVFPKDGSKDIDVATYVGFDDNDLMMRWDIAYVGDDWLFTDSIIFSVDGEIHKLNVDRLADLSTNVYSGGIVFEGYDWSVDSVSLLVDIVNADTVKIRMAGERQFDHVLTAREIDIIKRALATYEEKGGRLP